MAVKLLCSRQVDNYLQSINPKLSKKTRLPYIPLKWISYAGYASINYILLPVSTQKLPKTSLFLTKYFNIQANNRKLNEKSEKLIEK